MSRSHRLPAWVAPWSLAFGLAFSVAALATAVEVAIDHPAATIQATDHLDFACPGGVVAADDIGIWWDPTISYDGDGTWWGEYDLFLGFSGEEDGPICLADPAQSTARHLAARHGQVWINDVDGTLRLVPLEDLEEARS